MEEHPLYKWLKKAEQYLEEPGDPAWESVRHQLLLELKLMDQMIYTEVYKIESFNILKKTYDDNEDLITNPKKAERFQLLLDKAFKDI